MHLPDAQKECTADLYSRKLRFAAAWQPAEDRKEESGDGQSRDCCFDSCKRSPCRGWQPPARAAGGRAGCPHRRPARPLPLTAALAWRRLAVRPVVLVLVDQAACHPPRTGACRPGPGHGGRPATREWVTREGGRELGEPGAAPERRHAGRGAGQRTGQQLALLHPGSHPHGVRRAALLR